MLYDRWAGVGYFVLTYPPSPDSDIGTLFSNFDSRDPYRFSPLATLVAFVLSLCQF